MHAVVDWRDLLLQVCIIFPMVGLGFEVSFTGMRDRWWGSNTTHDNPIRALSNHVYWLGVGHSSVLYIPLYACIPIIFYFSQGLLFLAPWYGRAVVYGIGGIVLEYIGMAAIDRICGTTPSEHEYMQSRWQVHGFTRLDYIPFWALAGFLFELLFKRLNGLPLF